MLPEVQYHDFEVAKKGKEQASMILQFCGDRFKLKIYSQKNAKVQHDDSPAALGMEASGTGSGRVNNSNPFPEETLPP